MALRSAAGGNLVLPDDPDNVVVPVGMWSASWQVRDAECAQADAGAGIIFLPIMQMCTWEFRCARDDDNYPEAVGFEVGQFLPELYFAIGSGGKADYLTDTLVTSVEPTCDSESGEVVRVVVRGKGGTVTPNQDIP